MATTALDTVLEVSSLSVEFRTSERVVPAVRGWLKDERKLAASLEPHAFWYQPLPSPPKSYDKWEALIYNFAQHLLDRYGVDELGRQHHRGEVAYVAACFHSLADHGVGRCPRPPSPA